jgi:hypothetical protein
MGTTASDPELETASKGGGKKQAPWNGVDFFVAVGENNERNWDDMVRYGFVSAGHGDKYDCAWVRPSAARRMMTIRASPS